MKHLWFTYLMIPSFLSFSALAQMDHSNMQHGTDAQSMQMPGDMTHPSSTNPPVKRATQSMQNSEIQQRMQTSGTAAATESIHHDTERLQEAENPAMRTGSAEAMPYPLGDAMQRAPITLQQWQDWAEKNNPTLVQAHALQQQSEQQARQAALPPNPTIGYSGEHIRGGSYGGGEQGAFVQQTVVLGGKLGLRSNVYRAQAAADKVGMEEQAARVRSDVQRAFYRALAAQAAATVRQQLLQVANDSVETAHRLANLGQADAPDVLQAEVESEQAEIDLVDAQRAYLQRFAMLAAVSNQRDLPVSPLAGELEAVPDLKEDTAVARALAESPSVQRAQQEVSVAEARVKQQKREPVPNLSVQAGEWYSGEQLDGSRRAAGWMGFAQAGVELPLWNRNQGGTAAAQAELAHAQAEVTRTQLRIRQDAAPLAQQYLSARFAAERYRTQLIPRAQRAYELYNLKYQQMAAAYPQVLMAQRTLFQLQIAYLHAMEEEWVSAVTLQNYTLTGGLDRPMSASAAGSMQHE